MKITGNAIGKHATWKVILISLLMLPVLSCQTAAVQRLDLAAYPYLDNETIGLFNAMEKFLEGPPGQFEVAYWGDEGLDDIAGEMGYIRYVIALSGYSIALAAAHTPAYRKPFSAAMDAAIGKMLDVRAWRDWMTKWNGTNPIGPDNIMYSGHLSLMMILHRKLFNDRKYESPTTLTYDDGRTFKTSIQDLTESLYRQTIGNVDSRGDHYFGVACEPSMVWMPCNTPHRIQQIMFDQLYGTYYAMSNADWLRWLKANMYNEETGLLNYLFFPKDSPPRYVRKHSGIYSAWLILFINAFDRDWSEKLYGRFKDYFLRQDRESPFGGGTAIVLDDPERTETLMNAFVKINLASGLSMVMARQLGDEALYQKLKASWDTFFYYPEWSQDQGMFGYFSTDLAPHAYQNGFALLARSIDRDINFRTVTNRPIAREFFLKPHVAEVSDRRAFINRAVFDDRKAALIVTVNGGQRLSEPVTLRLAGFDSSRTHQVSRNGRTHAGWQWDGAHLVVKTPALSEAEETYVISIGK